MIKVRFDNQILVHAKAPYGFQQDYTLCGLDCEDYYDINNKNMADDIGYCLPLTGHDKINCHQCISIIKHCKTYKTIQLQNKKEV